jgi:hypothetical protein
MKALPLPVDTTVIITAFPQTPVQTPSPAYRAIVQDAQSHVKRVDVQQFRVLRGGHPDPVLIDVRESDDWTKDHATGAVHITKGMIKHDIEAKIPKKMRPLSSCHSGARSALAAENEAATHTL